VLRGAAVALLALGLALPVAANPAVVKTDQARAELVAHAPEGVKPGAPLWLGLQIQHQPHWHTYWKNPGDSGLPTTLAFTLPDGFQVGDIAWPTPRPLPVGPLVNFGYEGQLLLPVEVTVPAGWQGPTLDIKLRADWLICKDVCIPEGGDFALQLPAQAATSLHTAAFEAARAAAPLSLASARATAVVDEAGLRVKVEGLPADWRGRGLAFLPEMAGVIDNAAKPSTRWDGADWSAVVPLSPQRSESPTAMYAVLVAAGQATGVRVPVTVSGTWPALGSTPAAAAAQASDGPAPAVASTSLWGALALALVGGLLLNLMPCVFPVLSLKVMGFAAQGQQRQQLLASGLAYTAGVILSFLTLAGVMMALRAGGEQLGWGFQLQSPWFVAALAALFTLIGLNLAGLFELGSVVPSSWAAARARHPLVDSLLTGVLAVAVASPCTAPFMGASLGLAATLPVVEALTIFAALGLGMAAPYLAATAWPAVARMLPRPGAWMVHFKTLMAFPMFATVVWLLWVIGHQAGVDGATAVLGVLLALAFAAWALGSPTLGRKARAGFAAVAGLCLALTLAWAVPSLGSSGVGSSTVTPPSGAGETTVTSWQPWSADRVRAALESQRPVFVDFTAAWCVTCQFNKRTVLNQPEVLADLQAKRVVLLRADWTRQDSAITAELARMNRNGVPVYALHVPGETQPRLLGEILSVQQVRDALKGLP
jgi:thiol:disulfide interchange protein DsbD